MAIKISWSGGAPVSASPVGLGISSSGKLYPKLSDKGAITGITWVPQESADNIVDNAALETEYGPYSRPTVGTNYYSSGTQTNPELLDIAKGYTRNGRGAMPYPFTFAAKLVGSLADNLYVEWRAYWTGEGMSGPDAEVELQTTRESRDYLALTDENPPPYSGNYADGASVWNHGLYYDFDPSPLGAGYYSPALGTRTPGCAPPQVFGFRRYAFISFRRWETFFAGYPESVLWGTPPDDVYTPTDPGPDGQTLETLMDRHLCDDPDYWFDPWTLAPTVYYLKSSFFFWPWGEIAQDPPSLPFGSCRTDVETFGPRALANDVLVAAGTLRLEAKVYDVDDGLIDTYEASLLIYPSDPGITPLPQAATFWDIAHVDFGGDDEPCGTSSCFGNDDPDPEGCTYTGPQITLVQKGATISGFPPIGMEEVADMMGAPCFDCTYAYLYKVTCAEGADISWTLTVLSGSAPIYATTTGPGRFAVVYLGGLGSIFEVKVTVDGTDIGTLTGVSI